MACLAEGAVSSSVVVWPTDHLCSGSTKSAAGNLKCGAHLPTAIARRALDGGQATLTRGRRDRTCDRAQGSRPGLKLRLPHR
jgi:hypothetical protein